MILRYQPEVNDHHDQGGCTAPHQPEERQDRQYRLGCRETAGRRADHALRNLQGSRCGIEPEPRGRTGGREYQRQLYPSGLIYTPLWAKGATAQHSMAVKQARESGSAGGLSVEELEKMTPHDWFLRFVVVPSVPLKRPQTPEDIGRTVVFLVSEDAKNITGQALSVCGGQIMY